MRGITRRREAAGGATSSPFRALRVPNYRRYFVGQVLTNSGTWTQSVAIAWIVLRETGSSSALGLVVAAQFTPMLLLGAWAGAIADRVNLRRMLMLTNAAGVVVAGCTAVLVSLGFRSVPVLALMCLLLGCAAAFEFPARQGFVGELVEPAYFPSAVGLNAATQGVARTAGSALAGLLIAVVGAVTCLYVNAFSYIAAIIALSLVDAAALHQRPPAGPSKGRVREGVRYARRHGEIWFALVAIGVMSTFAMNDQVTTPLLARLTFHSGPGLFAIFGVVSAIGSTIGAMLIARRTESTVGLLGVTSLLVGVATFALAAAPFAWIAILALGLSSVVRLMYVCATSARLQQETDPAFRGRVMSFYLILNIGSTPVGAVLVGALADATNPRVAVAAGGVVALGTGVVALARSRRPAAPEGGGLRAEAALGAT